MIIKLNNKSLQFEINDKVSREKYGDECCVYNKRAKSSVALNPTATAVFLFIDEVLRSGVDKLTVDEIAEYLSKRFFKHEKEIPQIKYYIEAVLLCFEIESSLFTHSYLRVI